MFVNTLTSSQKSNFVENNVVTVSVSRQLELVLAQVLSISLVSIILTGLLVSSHHLVQSAS